jgi:hypothetical protein
VLSAACSSGAAAAVCETAESQLTGGGSVPRAHQEQRLQCVTPPRLRSRRVLSAACPSGAAAAVCDAAEAQQAGGCSVPLAHHEQRLSVFDTAEAEEPAGVQCRVLIRSSGCSV